MTGNRIYRKALPQKTVRAELEKGCGIQFGPQIDDLMSSLIDEDKRYCLREHP